MWNVVWGQCRECKLRAVLFACANCDLFSCIRHLRNSWSHAWTPQYAFPSSIEWKQTRTIIKYSLSGLQYLSQICEAYLVIRDPNCHNLRSFSWQLEEQAVGRCWRMGQERPVVIKRFRSRLDSVHTVGLDIRVSESHGFTSWSAKVKKYTKCDHFTLWIQTSDTSRSAIK